MLKIGLTGGLGSGKTFISKIFKVLGIPVFISDVESRRLMHEDDKLKNIIRSTFGNYIYKNDQLNSKELSMLVFNDKKALYKLNSLVHPVVNLSFKNWCKKQSGKYIIKESAILFESGYDADLDLIICVSAPYQLRVNRVKLRDGYTDQQVNKRMLNQWDEERKIAMSDYIIINDNKKLLIPQIIELNRLFLKVT